MNANGLLTTWSEFLLNLKHRFGASMYEDPQGNLSKLTQTSSVAEFQSAFEKLMNKVTGISKPLLVSFFITGLKPSIRQELLFSRPSTLMEAFAIVRAYEARKSPFTPHFPTSPSPHKQTPPGPSNTAFPAPTHKANPPALPPLLSTLNLPICRLSPAELRKKREKGLCYNCDKKYSANHRCRNKYLVLLGTDDEVNAQKEAHIPPKPDDEGVTGDISTLNALAGQGNPHSLHLIGEIDHHQFHVIIDSGSTHNFVKLALVERLGLAIQPTTKFRVYIGNGDYLLCQYVCPQMALLLQGSEFVLDLFVLPIKGPEVVLGIQWLQQLSRVAHD